MCAKYYELIYTNILIILIYITCMFKKIHLVNVGACL